MVAEVLAALKPVAGGCYADATVGGGGHAAAILAASAPDGWLYGCDCDAGAIEAARVRLAEFTGRFELRQANFAELAEWIPLNSCDGVLFDLGPSSAQLDNAQRGFSFMNDGPLDMRFDTRQSLTAAELLNRATQKELESIFRDVCGEGYARKVAHAIIREREVFPTGFHTTRQLARLIERIGPRKPGRIHPATKVFLALRIAVNDEIGCLKRGLESAVKILKRGGRVVVITFHSLEDRVVKDFVRARARTCCAGVVRSAGAGLGSPGPHRLRWVERKPITPSETEVAENPRSRSAKLRVFEKV